MTFTVLGSSGFIGSHLVAALRAAGEEVSTPRRGEDPGSLGELGHVIDCVGVTSDFRTRPLDAVEAHVDRILPILRSASFQSFLYLSSTRVYRGEGLAHEDDHLSVLPAREDDLYNLSKLMGEAACLSSGRSNVRVVRLSNVYGAGMARDNFLSAVILEAVERSRVVLSGTFDSCKDYVAIEDVVAMLPLIATEGRHRIYNLASGRNVTHGTLAHRLAELTGSLIMVGERAVRTKFPQICIERLTREFGFAPQQLEQRLAGLVEIFRERTVAA